MKAQGLTTHTGEFLLRTMNTSHLENLPLKTPAGREKPSGEESLSQSGPSLSKAGLKVDLDLCGL